MSEVHQKDRVVSSSLRNRVLALLAVAGTWMGGFGLLAALKNSLIWAAGAGPFPTDDDETQWMVSHWGLWGCVSIVIAVVFVLSLATAVGRRIESGHWAWSWEFFETESGSKTKATASAVPENSALFEAERAGSKTAESSACLKCGQTIPVDLSRCPICGWTWEEATEE